MFLELIIIKIIFINEIIAMSLFFSINKSLLYFTQIFIDIFMISFYLFYFLKIYIVEFEDNNNAINYNNFIL